MQTTMNLLDAALKRKKAAQWIEQLKIARSTFSVARNRGHLSPAIAGVLAEEMGENVDQWIVIAALESERESACKTRMVKRYNRPRSYDAGSSKNWPIRGGKRGVCGFHNLTRRLVFSVVNGMPHMSASTGHVYQPVSYSR